MKQGYFLTSDRAQIYYEDSGEGDTILFVPGHMCTSKFFHKNAEELQATHRVISIDPRGFGNSSKVLVGNNVERHADDLKELMDFLGLTQVTLLGWSLSGSVVVTYAHKYKGFRLKAIGLLDCALFPFSSAPWNSYASRNYNMEDWCDKYNRWITNPSDYFQRFTNRIKEGLTPEELTMVQSEIAKTPPWIGFAIHSDWCHTNTEKLLRELTVPIFLAYGQSPDSIQSMFRHYYEEIVSYKELHEFERGGHVMFWVEHQQFNRALINFINKLS